MRAAQRHMGSSHCGLTADHRGLRDADIRASARRQAAQIIGELNVLLVRGGLVQQSRERLCDTGERLLAEPGNRCQPASRRKQP